MNDYQNPSINPIVEKTADGTPPPIILQQIVVRPLNRTKQDAQSWRNATRFAESQIPRRVALYDLYADIMLDGHVIAVTGKRVDAVINAKWHFVDKNGDPVDEINTLIDSLGFEEMVKEIHNSKNWGYTMGVCRTIKNDEGYELYFDLIPRKHMRPDTGIVATEQMGDAGFNIREGFYTSEVLEAGNPKDLGLLLGAGYYYVLKRGNVADMASFIEVFGQGIIDATWNGFDENQRAKLSTALADIGNGGVILRPEGTTVAMLENKTNSDGKLHSAGLEFYNAEISKALLGTTETTQSSDSSGYAQSQTHQEDDNDKSAADINFVRRILNSRFRRILQAQGVDTKGGKFIVAADEMTLSPKDKVDMAAKMANDLEMPIDHDDMYETTGVKKPDNYDQQIADKKAAKEQETQNTGKTPKGKKADTPTPTGANKDKKPGKLRLMLEAYRHFFE